ncbi:unnamed protein product [Dracunculus medinensis]|uniref:Protein SZT2 n=1 Tax=Dracunculus medinensis TaxID=318479 RepID=A0A0N4UAY6_DRAME|nr:unnamed protein product [Dracunculus medinensis]
MSKGNNSSREEAKNFNEIREAREVFLFMHRDFRVSRNIRALWLFDHLNKFVSIEHADFDVNSVRSIKRHSLRDFLFFYLGFYVGENYGKEIKIVGIIAKDNGAICEGEQLKICTDTVVTFLSKLYRLVFVLDLSPSVFVVDDSLECVLHERLLNCLQKCLRDFNFPGTQRKFRPQLYISICVYTPFISFEEEKVLLQGILLNSENIENILEFVRKRFTNFVNNLCTSMQPHLRRWNSEWKREIQDEEFLPQNFFASQPHQSDDNCVGRSSSAASGNSKRKNSGNFTRSDEGFIHPEWSLIFMLGTGLLGIQMLPENTQSGIIIITDGICSMPDLRALQQLLTQLRSFTVTCSFIQIQQRNFNESVFGHVSCPELLHFLAMATFGTYLPECQCSMPVILPPDINAFHRALLCWNFQRALADNVHIRNLVKEINPGFADFYTSDIVRRRYLSVEYETSLPNLLYVRMREGYTIKGIRELLKVSLIFEAPYNIMKDLLVECSSLNRQITADVFKNSINSLIQADHLLIHIHSFNQHRDYFSLPSKVNSENPLFRFLPNGSKSTVTLHSRELESQSSLEPSICRFIEFWRLLSDLDEGIWQKWVHTHILRLVLTHDQPLPKNIFMKNCNSSKAMRITSQDALIALNQTFSQLTTFPLVRNQSYIKFVGRLDKNQVPEFFYLVRTNVVESPFITVKFAFLGGISCIVDDIKRRLKSLSMDIQTFYTVVNDFSDVRDDTSTFYRTSQVPAVTVVRRPLERILVRYKNIPPVLDRIIRLEKTYSCREKILHNAIAQYLCCKRRIWYIKSFCTDYLVSALSAEYILHTILQ